MTSAQAVLRALRAARGGCVTDRLLAYYLSGMGRRFYAAQPAEAVAKARKLLEPGERIVRVTREGYYLARKP